MTILSLMTLMGKTALVTGAAKRLGRAIAFGLAASGVNLVIHHRESHNEAETLAAEVNTLGRQAWVRNYDLTAAAGIEAWFREAAAESGGVDILINSASVYPKGGYADMTVHELYEVMKVNTYAPMALIRALAAQGRPAVAINLLDARLDDRNPLHAAYHLSKGALHTITRDMARELAPDVRVNAVAPGLILPRHEVRENAAKRFTQGTVEEVCQAVLFLISNGAVTGQTIFIDGGRHLWRSVHEES